MTRSKDPATPENTRSGQGVTLPDSSPSTRRSERSEEDYHTSQPASSVTSSYTTNASFTSGSSLEKRPRASSTGNDLDTQGPISYTDVTAGFGGTTAVRETKSNLKQESIKRSNVLDHINQCIEDSRKGEFEVSSWLEFHVSYDEFKQWIARYERDWFVKHKIRFDYFYPHRLIIRMGEGARHELLERRIDYHIERQLDEIAESNSALQRYARKVRPEGSSDIKLKNKSSLHPDISFRSKDSKYPGVIIEIADSQSTRNLEEKAWEYILRSGGNVNAVVGLAVNRDNQRAWIKVWRPLIINDGEQNDILSIDEGRVVNFPTDRTRPSGEEDGIRLPLSDFVSDDTCEDGEIHIPWARISRILDEADEAEAERQTRKREWQEEEEEQEQDEEAERGTEREKAGNRNSATANQPKRRLKLDRRFFKPNAGDNYSSGDSEGSSGPPAHKKLRSGRQV